MDDMPSPREKKLETTDKMEDFVEYQKNISKGEGDLTH